MILTLLAMLMLTACTQNGNPSTSTTTTISTTKKYGSEHYDEVIQIRETLHNAIKEDLKMGKKDWN